MKTTPMPAPHPPMRELRLRGRPASPGFAAGPIVALKPIDAPSRNPSSNPVLEAKALFEAVAGALADTLALQVQVDGEAAGMVAFQAAMLEDPELIRSASIAIANGTQADIAWLAAMDAEIAGYTASEDPYFRARAADLQDIRDRVLAKLRPGVADEIASPGSVIASTDLSLSRFLAIDWNQGGAILLTQGSPTSHVAMLARARGVPMIVDLGGVPWELDGKEALVDAVIGEVVIDAQAASHDQFVVKSQTAERAAAGMAAHLATPACTVDGTRIAMHLNIIGPEELDLLNPAICDGIGLFRTEFLFHGGRLPDEDAQYAIYRTVVGWAQGRTVTVRTLDAGGDKPIPGVTEERESNPFLGLRGLRLSLRHPDLFRVQLRALLRAARHGNVRIMLPMVTVPGELTAARDLVDTEIEAFARAGEAVPRPALGIMVEVPAAAIGVDQFDADFFSIGSNDLTQYVTAAGRDIASVADLADPCNPAVLRLIETVVRHGRKVGRDVSLCGDAGGNPAVIPALLATGLRSLSVAPGLLAGAKHAVSAVDLRGERR
jgi:phosphoenolpyruvate-protein phosphotransferase (PTS system enzyme I)